MTVNIVNIMNFVRGFSSTKDTDLLTPLKEELKLCNEYGYKNTMLFQYDALIREDMMNIYREYGIHSEAGVWIEIVKPLCESVNIKWRGREGWDWDWHVNPGFLMAYTQSERELLIDELMNKFKEIFGSYPECAGSWLLDAYSMEYMQKKYDIKAFAICREQYGVDAYTLHGGYYNQAYYPSKYNCICPASTAENQINAPVFRLLGPDPVYNYGSADFYEDQLDTVPTIEAAWLLGRDEKYVKWFFDSYFNRESMEFSYMQIGQENPFGWEAISKGLTIQFKVLKDYLESGKCTLMTLKESGEWFSENYKKTPQTAIGAKNIIGNDINESQWYNCVNYRVNFVSEADKFYIRDINKFDEKNVEVNYTEPCTKWQIAYHNLPVMDGYLWRNKDTNRAGIYFDGKYKSMDVLNENGVFTIKAHFEKETKVIKMTEEKIEITTSENIRFVFNNVENTKFIEHEIKYNHNGREYSVGIKGNCTADGVISPKNGKIVLSFV